MADYRLDVDVYELPSLVIERRGQEVCAFAIAKETTAYHNGQEITRTVMLKDRDCVSVEQYRIVYSDPTAASETGPVAKVASSEYRSVAKNGDFGTPERNKGAVRSVFGTSNGLDGFEDMPGVAATQSIQVRVSARDAHPGARYQQEDPPSFDLIEDRVIVIVGVVLLMALILVVAAWLLL